MTTPSSGSATSGRGSGWSRPTTAVRPTGVTDGHRPNWGIGQRLSGDGLLARARITIEDAERIAPGETGFVRIHPTSWDAWADVRPGEQIPMLEGPRIVGIAEVVEVVLPGRRS